MTQAKHTPGPWATYVNKEHDVVIRKMLSNGMECCEIARVKTGFSDSRLIAAAPDLLNALESVLNEFAKDGYGGEFEDGEHPVIDAARAAIAKATGA